MNIVSQQYRFTFALLASLVAHLLLAWVIAFKLPAPEVSKKTASPMMDVILLDDSQISKGSALSNAQITSNKNSHGQLQDAQDNRNVAPKSPNLHSQQTTTSAKAAIIQPSQPSTSPTKKQPLILSRKSVKNAAPQPPKQTSRQESKPTTTPNIPLANLLPTSSALTQLSREFDREKRMKQLLSKEADIGFNTRESKYAAYMQSMISSLEAAWHYTEGDDYLLDDFFRKNPQESALKILIRISVKHNGELASVKIIRPSPNRQLNHSATAAVHSAAPFKPLPSSWGLDRVNWFITFDATQNTLTFQPEHRRF